MRNVAQTMIAVGFVVGAWILQSEEAAAQLGKSTIRGTISDETGAMTPGATLVLTEMRTNISRTTTSDDLGNYELPGLKDGTYRLEVSMPGFRTFVADNLILQSAQVRRVDARLTVGELAEQLTVNAGAAVIERDDSKLSASLDAAKYEQSPQVVSYGFNPTAYLFTLPGVQGGESGWGTLSIGGVSSANNITEGMDGAQTDGAVNQIHNMEDVAELTVVTHNNTADVGRAAYFNLVSKQGTNEFHGNAYYYHSNGALNARDFFASSKPPFKVHIAGASAGGPIWKDKTFFYTSYYSTIDPSKTSIQATVPTDNMRQGDFSELSGTIVNPFTGEPFTENRIPSELINPLSKRFQELSVPAPNRGASGTLLNNLEFLHEYPGDLHRVDFYAARIDHQISKNNNLFGRWSNRWTPYVLAGPYPGMEWTRERYAWQMTYADTHIFSPTLVSEVRFGWYLNKVDDGGEVDGVTPRRGDQVVEELGLQGVNRQGLREMGSPYVDITGYSPFFTRPGGKIQDDNERSYAGMLTWVKGRHTWKFGGELRTFDNTTAAADSSTYGNVAFDGRFTGSGYADFLLGLPSVSQRSEVLFGRTTRSYELAFYGTDTFRVGPRLTLDLGLRWDYFGAARYGDGLMYNWDPETGNIVVPDDAIGSVSPLYPEEISVVAGDVAVNPDTTNFAPRLGFAFRINDKTVLRGGYGIFTEFWGHYPYAYGGGPFEIAETYINGVTNETPLFAFPNPFPSGGAVVPSQNVTGYPLEGENGYIQQFNLTLEREIEDIGFTVSYLATRGRGLNFDLMINKPAASTVPFTQDRRPYPQFVNASFAQTAGASNYDALVIGVSKKVGDLTFNNHWTWAHSMANNLNLEDTHNWEVWNQEWIVPRHRFVWNVHWNVPVGHGRRYLTDTPRVVNAILGNWALAWNAFVQTGQFLTPSFSGADVSNTDTFGGLPDRICDGNLPSGQRTIDQWFDPSCFVVPPAGRFGNAGVNVLEGPGRHVHNLNVSKEFYVSDDFRMQFNVAIGNLFNHPNFSLPVGNISIPDVASVTSTVGPFNNESAGARQVQLRLRLKW